MINKIRQMYKKNLKRKALVFLIRRRGNSHTFSLSVQYKVEIKLMTYQDDHVSVVLLHDIPSQLTPAYESFLLCVFKTKDEKLP